MTTRVRAVVAALALLLPGALGSCAPTPTTDYATAHKGDVVILGTWEQDGDATNGAEPLEWIVLDRIDDRLLLLTADVVAARPYHHVPFEPITWADSDLRAWLNTDFLTQALTPAEQDLVQPTVLDNLDQSIAGTDGGAPTTDRVLALSETDAVIYLSTDWDREWTGRATVTDAASSPALYTDDEGHTDWWLRSPGGDDYAAQYVSADGEPITAGIAADAELGVRPALWLSVWGTTTPSSASSGEPRP
ncbi:MULTISPECIES: DUF6273 domain-containing protein [Actinomyces]|uniref:DUF6273 domain-containing protein n=1 Tax=Actinomyces respiraculi TaxID=2744574 RepID=A0A7T0PWI2_9ACTO|nr:MULTISPECIES: DUF6273 domain-containing protein [Actinomyces]QPL05498.1 hypothetical protein ID810_00380 [Actinomyces respiraculi]